LSLGKNLSPGGLRLSQQEDSTQKYFCFPFNLTIEVELNSLNIAILLHIDDEKCPKHDLTL
jgi:hypothetical protein